MEGTVLAALRDVVGRMDPGRDFDRFLAMIYRAVPELDCEGSRYVAIEAAYLVASGAVLPCRLQADLADIAAERRKGTLRNPAGLAHDKFSLWPHWGERRRKARAREDRPP